MLKIGDTVHDPGDPSVGISSFYAEIVGKLDENHFLARDEDWWIVVFPSEIKQKKAILGDGREFPQHLRFWHIGPNDWAPLDEIVREWDNRQ